MNLPISSVVLGVQKLSSKLLTLNKLRGALAMPKNRPYIPGLQIQRMKNKEKICDDEPASISYLQFLGSGANGAPRSLYFFTNKKRYMFNVGEGTQRIAHEHKVKISRMEHIFITYPIWENIGGLPGLALTLQECGVPDITIHGPKGLSSIFEATKRFVILNNLNIRSVISEKNEFYQDGSVRVEYVPLVSSDPTMFLESPCSMTGIINDIVSVKDDIDYYAYLKTGKSHCSGTNSTVFDASKICMDSISAGAPIAMAYICSLTPKAGALNLEMCVEKGVPAGPLLGKLKSGEDVTLPNGVIVKSADVKFPDQKGPSFIVVDCPTVDFTASLCNEKSFQKFQKPELNPDALLPYIIHFSPSEVMKDERYQAWMQKFPPSTLHVNANDKNTCLGCVGVHEMQYKLNKLDPEVFPLLADDSIPISNYSSRSWDLDHILENAKKNKNQPDEGRLLSRDAFNLPDDCGSTLRILPLRPANYEEKNFPDCVFLTPVDYIEEIMHIKGFTEELELLKKKVASLNSNTEPKQYPHPRITFLGTGSCIPNKCRNTSGILVSMNQENHILMDCGEGTYGQIVRHFGSVRADKILANLNIIFISHLHADHHIGLISILKKRRRAAKLHNAKLTKVFLLAPKTILFWLVSYQQQFEEIFDCVEFIANQDLEYRSKIDDLSEKLLKVAPLADIVTSYVVHCPQAFGISFTHENGCKITYSGDTMPSKDLINIGTNSHLLIHEATFEDSLVSEAKQKYHSTTCQAIDVGIKMEAKFTLLTHFSQRYYKLPLITDNFTENVGIAFDNMEISISDLPKLHLFNPALQLMFEEQIESIRAKNIKRKRMEST